MQNRENVLQTWIKSILGKTGYTIRLLAGDASFRRYYRIQYAGLTRVIMDAPPEKESIESFVLIAKILQDAGVYVPKLHIINLEQGFILLDDLGDRLFGQAIIPNSPEKHYQAAMSTLLMMQNCFIDKSILPTFDIPFMHKEMELFQEWFLKAYLDLKLTNDEDQLIYNIQNNLAKTIIQQPQVFIHRDYHSRNIMVINDNQPPTLAIIDFQDAMIGPITYDLVSLLKDCYVCWPRKQVLTWVRNFYEDCQLANTYFFEDFIKAFDFCGLQRHLKILGIFSRLYLRDNKAAYLKDLPLTLNYVLACTEYYEELYPLHRFLQQRVILP